jgi:hypothetical protein
MVKEFFLKNLHFMVILLEECSLLNYKDLKHCQIDISATDSKKTRAKNDLSFLQEAQSKIKLKLSESEKIILEQIYKLENEY